MKILVISSYLPYPLFSGGQVRLYNLIKTLSNKHEITLICEKRPHQTAKDVAEVKKICKEVITVNRKKQWSVSNIVKAGVSSNSFLVSGHTQPQFKKKIQKVLSEYKFDLIHIETYYVIKNLPETNLPIVLVEHNIEYSVYDKYKERTPAIFRPFLSLDISKIRKEEEAAWKQAKALVAVSREDQTVMKRAGFESFLVSNGVNTDQFLMKNVQQAITTKEKRVLFLGDFNWIQNRDTVTFIIKDIWPLIKEKFEVFKDKPVVKLWVVGRKIPDTLKSLTNDPDVLFDEKSSSLPTEKIFQTASVLLAPIRIGGGTSYKILEAMSCGTPVITMQMSANALGAKDNIEIAIGKDAEELASKTFFILHNNPVYNLMSKNGRSFVERNYTWKEIAWNLDQVYKQAVLY